MTLDELNEEPDKENNNPMQFRSINKNIRGADNSLDES